jgi:hypothetical protein
VDVIIGFVLLSAKENARRCSVNQFNSRQRASMGVAWAWLLSRKLLHGLMQNLLDWKVENLLRLSGDI